MECGAPIDWVIEVFLNQLNPAFKHVKKGGACWIVVP